MFVTKTKPFNHQADAYNRFFYPMVDGKREIVALFMEQGTGKTKTALDLASNLFLENKIDGVMVIAPNGVHEQWADEQVPEHVHKELPYDVLIWDNKQTKAWKIQLDKWLAPNDSPSNRKLKFFCVNVEAFSNDNHLSTFKKFVENFRTYIVVDESTRIKNPSANRTINICYSMCKLIKEGRKVKEVIHLSKYRSVLTGTMVTGSPYDLWSMFEFMQHNYFGMNYYSFKNKYGLEVKDTEPFSGRTYNRKIRKDEIESIRRYHEQEGMEIETIAGLMGTTESNVRYILAHPEIELPYKNLDQLKKTIAKDSFILRKEDALDLPPKMHQTIYVEMNSEQKRIYRELQKELLSVYDEKELTVKNKVSLLGRLQQVTGGFFPYDESDGNVVPITSKNPKLEFLKKEIEETGNETIIIWARFVAEIRLIKQELSKAFPDKVIEAYYGSVDTKARKDIIERFKDGHVDIFIANKTASTGLNLQVCHYQIFYSNSYSLEDRLQMEDRSHRSGQKNAVLYRDLVMKGTVDEQVYKVLKGKKDLLDYFRDNSLMDFMSGKNIT